VVDSSRPVYPTAHSLVLSVQALVSIGYKGVALPGLEDSVNFDGRSGVCIHTHGKVESASEQLGGLYVSGWLKRGPSGIIGTNIADAKDTVASIMKDLQDQKSHGTDSEDIHALLSSRDVKVVDWSAYERINAAESSSPKKRTKEQSREKIANGVELIRVALAPSA
jgi:NADPH-dependent glutamate synthase beta subunit-like oxidoreductase